MSATKPLKKFRAILIEWQSFKAFIDATDAEAARAIALELWNDHCCDGEGFSFCDGGFESLEVEDISAEVSITSQVFAGDQQ